MKVVSMSDEEKIKKINDRLDTLSIEEFQAMTLEKEAETKKDFEQFSASLSEGICYYCKYPITHFSAKKPCLHWFLKPNGFKKKYFNILMEERGFRQINTYLRWVSNTETIAANINDLVEEKSSNNFIEETISYKNLEWSFSCSENDRKGHLGSQVGLNPHYHFQMKVNGNVIINYNSFHLPFTDHDEFSFAVESGKINRLFSMKTHDVGMQGVFDLISHQNSEDDILQYTEDSANAAFHSDIMIMAEPGKTISGDQIADLIEERKQTGVSLSVLARKLENVSVNTIVTPAEGVPEMAKRTGRKRKRD